MLIEEAPKYGNDNDYVDNLVVEAYDSYLDEIKNIQILATSVVRLAESVMAELLPSVPM